MSPRQHCNIILPDWVRYFIDDWTGRLEMPEQQMALAVALSSENVRNGTGGPFGAIVINEDNGQLLATGVNLVIDLDLSMAHAEMVALSLAQTELGHWHLGQGCNTVLVASCEPCAMCFGAVPWSGVGKLVCGARKSDAEAAGFDEGDKPPDWQQCLEQRGINVTRDVLRAEAAAVLMEYANNAGEIYGPRT